MEKKRTWKPTFAGVLDIILGCLSLIEVIGLFLAGIACDLIHGIFGGGPYFHCLGSVSVIAVPLFVFGILAIRGGIYALTRKRWRFALVGSIAAFLHSIIIMLLIGYMLWNMLLIGFIISPILLWDAQDFFFVFVAFLSVLLPGIAAIVFTVLSKKEFE